MPENLRDMAEKSVEVEKSGESGKEGGSIKSSLRSLLPQSTSKEATSPSSPNLRSAGRLFGYWALYYSSSLVIPIISYKLVCRWANGSTSVYMYAYTHLHIAV